MQAIKANKVYTITEAEKASYVKSGYDILDDNGKVIEYGVGKSVEYSKFKKLEDKCKALEAENENLKLQTMTVEQLKAYANEQKVELGDATTKEAILAKFKEAQGE